MNSTFQYLHFLSVVNRKYRRERTNQKRKKKKQSTKMCEKNKRYEMNKKEKREIPTILLFSLVFSFSFFSCCSNSARSLLTFSARVSFFFFFFSGGGEVLELKEKTQRMNFTSIFKNENEKRTESKQILFLGGSRTSGSLTFSRWTPKKLLKVNPHNIRKTFFEK